MDVVSSVYGQTGFTLDLYKAVVKEEESKNAALSPLSIGLALAMVATGAKGPTLEQIASCIKLPPGDPMHHFSSHLKNVIMADGSKSGGPQLALANRVWVDSSVKLKPAFQKILKESYGSEATSVDFRHESEEARERVNTWAKDETHGKIENLLPQDAVDAATRLVLANALYFKGAWANPFDGVRTREEDFFLLDGKSIKVPMMHSYTDKYVKRFSTFTALSLPYENGQDERLFSMIFLLPHDKKGLMELEENLDITALSKDLKNFEKVPVKKFALPRFKISSGFQVPTALKNLGLTLPFENDADLSGMVESEMVCISDVHHKAFVEVNEAGTEAAAVTSVEIMLMCMPFGKPVEFKADHPFMFLIKEESTDLIFFTGRVTDPSVEN